MQENEIASTLGNHRSAIVRRVLTLFLGLLPTVSLARELFINDQETFFVSVSKNFEMNLNLDNEIFNNHLVSMKPIFTEK